ncbi:MAG: response regulator transcription factor [Thermoleophilaceae bacterium]
MAQATDPSSVRVVVRDRAPAYSRGLEAALMDAGYLVEHPVELEGWAERSGTRALVLTCASWDDARDAALLRARGVDMVAVALLAEGAAVGYREVLETGVDSAVPRDAPLDRIVEVVGAALERRTVLPTDVARTLARSGQQDDAIDGQQAEWLRALARGATVEELAESVGYSERAMYRQLRRLYERLGASNRTEALLQALRRGLID